jgi:hypothetical protein
MTDGRVVEFPGKRKLIKTSKGTPEGKLEIVLDFLNGETRLFTLPEALLTQFALHGAEQKLGDEMAGLDDIEDGILAVDNLIDRLYEGKWALSRESSGMAGTSILARALMEVQSKPASVVRDFLAAKTQAEKVALRNNPRVLPVIQRLEAEKAARAAARGKVPAEKPSIDTDSLLDALA